MKKIVVKFGGSILRTPNDIKKMLSAIRNYSQNLIIVVSALFGVTGILDSLLSKDFFKKDDIDLIISKLKQLHFNFINENFTENIQKKCMEKEIESLLNRLKDYLTGLHLIEDIPDFSRFFVLSFGERLSSTLISSFLTHKGVENRRMTPEEIGLYADRCAINASADFEKSEPIIRKNLSNDFTYVIPGYYGIIDGSRVALFGKGGSDYTAAVIAKCTDSPYCDFWKDVDGFMTADPKLVKNAKKVAELSYEEAAELSYFGAQIIHPETFSPLKSIKIPVRIFNINNSNDNSGFPEPSTRISGNPNMSKNVIKSITFSNDFSILRVKGSGVGIHPGIISSISDKLNRININIRSIITTQTSINFILSAEDIKKSFLTIRSLDLPGTEIINMEIDISLIAAVGTGFRESYGIAARILSVLSREKINIRLITAGASDEAIYFTIRKDHCSRAVQTLHREFFEHF